jgi:hypothetical protein
MAEKLRSHTGVFWEGWLNMHGVLRVYNDRLVIRALGQDYIFPRDKIAALRVSRFLWWRRITIEHSIPEETSYIGFRPYTFSEVQQDLAAAGFTLAD